MPYIDKTNGYEFFLIGEPGCPIESKYYWVQDFKQIHSKYKCKEEKFVDVEFPPNEESLGRCDILGYVGAEEIVWKRPHELVKLWSANKDEKACDSTTKGPYFMDPHGFNLGDINQGGLGNCWYLSAIAILTTNKTLFQIVVPEDNKNGFKEGEYSGAFHYRFWKAGYWVDIVIDDLLPCMAGAGGELKLLFSAAPNNEFWAALAEKAYAKFWGSYANTEGGHPSWALEDFTGGMSEFMFFSPGITAYDPKRLLITAYNSKSLMACGSIFYEWPDYSEMEDQGIVMGHAYSITNVQEVKDKFGVTHFLIRLRNPWGQVEFTGKWSDCDDKSWSTVPVDLRRTGAFDKNDGEFWMCLEDFHKNFGGLYICYWTPPYLKKDKLRQRNWQQEVRHGEWIIDTSICNNPGENRDIPAYTTVLSDVKCEAVGVTHVGEGCPLIVNIMLKRKETTGMIGFRIYKVNDWDSSNFTSDFFRKAEEITDAEIVSKRAEAWWDVRCTKMFHVPPGKYCIVPFVTLDYGEYYLPKTIPFVLRILTETETCLIEIAPKPGPLPVIHDDCQETEKRLRVKAKKLFLKYAGEDKMLDCCELKRLLENACESETLFNEISNLTCKKLINSVDPDFIGKINFSSACKIFIKLNKYRDLYLKSKKGGKENAGSPQLAQVLKCLGFLLSCKALRRLSYTYEDPIGKLSFDGLVQACVTVENCYGTFNRHAYGEGDEINLTMNDWIQIYFEV